MTQRIEYTEELVGNAHPTKNDTLNRFINLITAQGDILYGTAAATAAALAKGAANTKLFMNAGATAPEWAAGLKVGTFTRDLTAASGDVAYTSVGFKPSAIIVVGGIANYSVSIGFDDATTKGGGSIIGTTPIYSITAVLINTQDGTNIQSAIVKTFDADGFTLTWTKTNSPTGTATYCYLALR